MPVVHTNAVSKRDYEALARFRQALRRFATFSEQAARAAGLTPQQHQVLLAIKGAPGRETLSVGEIATALMIRPHSAVELIDRLAQLGLVRRRDDPHDHRRVQVALTAAAEATLEELSAAHVQELRRVRPALTDLLHRFESPE
ncbi:MAG TPA: helix-turn-helix domain-containing protein [Acetobacteraceae bacterium]|nr:helix-turn-helix domain-containing protein [Acetobacteraceae bacterium]